MKIYLLDSSINLISKSYPNYSQTQLKTIRYGLEGIYITISKTIIILGIAFYFNLLKELLVVVAAYNLLRMFSFGLHANNSISCLIASTSIFITATYLCTTIIFTAPLKIIISVMSIIIFLKYSPADTAKRPIISKKRRIKYKLISTSIIIIYSLVLNFTNNIFINNVLLISMVIQSFLISPLSYYLFKQSYNNYLNKKGGKL